jgi:hypothetical protein
MASRMMGQVMQCPPPASAEFDADDGDDVDTGFAQQRIGVGAPAINNARAASGTRASRRDGALRPSDSSPADPVLCDVMTSPVLAVD